MRWKISHRRGHDPRQIDLLAALALLIVIVATWHVLRAAAPKPPSTSGLHRAKPERSLVTRFRRIVRFSAKTRRNRRELRLDGRRRTRAFADAAVWAAAALGRRSRLGGAAEPSSGSLTDSSRFDSCDAPAIADAEIHRLRPPEQLGIVFADSVPGIRRSDRHSGRTERTAISSGCNRRAECRNRPG